MHLFSGFWMFLCYFRCLSHSYRADFSNFAPFLPKVTPKKALMGIINQLLTNIMNNNYDYHSDRARDCGMRA